MTYGPLLIRADASVEIGTGHVMRCLALGQAWQDSGGQVKFCCAKLPLGLHERLEAEGMSVHLLDVESGSSRDAQATIAEGITIAAAWVVVDGYVFGTDYQKQIKEAGLRLLFIDDYGHSGRYAADLVVSQNAYASPSDYLNRENDTSLLLGTPYALLRREFRQWTQYRRDVSQVARNVLVTMGGSDPKQATQKAIDALRNLTFNVAIVVGGSNPNLREIQAAAECISGMQVHVNVSDMPTLMDWADIAIASASSTFLELAMMGVPSIVMIVADNQIPISEFAQRQGLAIALGNEDAISAERIKHAILELAHNTKRRQQMSLLGQAIVDGRGAWRVAGVMQNNSGPALRPVTWDDRGLVWLWANDPQTRANSFRNDPIPWENHCTWFEKQLHSVDVRFWILEQQGTPVGHIRYQIEVPEQMAVISLVVGPQYRGQGYGTQLLELTKARAAAELEVSALKGVTLATNPASGRAFLKAGFLKTETSSIDGQECVLFKWRTDNPNLNGVR